MNIFVGRMIHCLKPLLQFKTTIKDIKKCVNMYYNIYISFIMNNIILVFAPKDIHTVHTNILYLLSFTA